MIYHPSYHLSTYISFYLFLTIDPILAEVITREYQNVEFIKQDVKTQFIEISYINLSCIRAQYLASDILSFFSGKNVNGYLKKKFVDVTLIVYIRYFRKIF